MTVEAERSEPDRTALGFFIVTCLILSIISQTPSLSLLRPVHAMPVDPPATAAPITTWGTFFGTSGDIQIDVNRTGIAVRVEIPREFLQGVVSGENDTHFIQSNIRNDYYYYSVVDESSHWSYNATANGPCVKPHFSIRDPNAPFCVEIWNYLNGTFRTFTPPKFVRFRGLNSPTVAGNYNVTLFVADHTNSVGYPDICQNPAKFPPEFCTYPDFAHAWNTTFIVPVSTRDAPASISGTICDGTLSTSGNCNFPIIGAKGVAYAQDSGGRIVARSYVNRANGAFNITGLAAGTYQILASAGFDAAFETAYLLTTDVSSVTVSGGQNSGAHNILLNRAPQVCGTIEYLRGGSSIAHSLTDTYLPSIGLKVLNVTVEATDPARHVYRNMTLSTDSGSDRFSIIIGSNLTYVGTDPYGTEFAGVPANTVLMLNVWVTGYLQVNLDGSPEVITVTSGSSPTPSSASSACRPSVGSILMRLGGAISGTIQFWNNVVLETPEQAEASLPLGGVTDVLFGGNVLIQAYDHLGVLRSVTVLNGTLPDGRACYSNPVLAASCKIKLIEVSSATGTQVELAFTIFGFSEYLNHTWSGVWGDSGDAKDYGLPPDSGYTIQVSINGYQLISPSPISLTLGQNVTDVNLKMLRGGAFQIGVFSFDNRFGTRATQSPFPFLSLNFTIPARARTYFYDAVGREVGFVECLIRASVPQPDRRCHLGTVRGSVKNSFTIIFAGENWSTREIWFFGDVPTHVGTSAISTDNYTIKTYTLGYVWQYGPTQTLNQLLGFSQAAVTLLLGDEIDITGPVFEDTSILGTLPENDHAIGQVLLGGTLTGATPSNLTAGTPTIILSILGFGGMTNSTGKLQGQGHFFYVGPDGGRNFDYGLDNTTYTALVPEFGFNRHFMQIVPPVVISFRDLFLQLGVVMSELPLAIVASTAVTGWVSSSAAGFPIAPLSWVQVTAANTTTSRTVPTLDGRYNGPGSLDLPEGTYTITFSVLFFKSQNLTLFVQWGGTYEAHPPEGPLCPTAGTPFSSCDPPVSLTPAQRQPTLATAVGTLPQLLGPIPVLGQAQRRPKSLVDCQIAEN